MNDFEAAPNGDVETLRSIYEPLTKSVRRLIDTTIRTEVDAATVARAKAAVDNAIELLSARVLPGSFGLQQTADGRGLVWGNVAIGLRNPIAPPLVVHHDGSGGVYADVELGAGYEGPPGHVHGGMCALILDHILGATAHLPGRPAYTGTLTVRYLRPTPLGLLHAQANVDRVEGAKTYAAGRLSDATGVTVEAHGVFIRPESRATTAG